MDWLIGNWQHLGEVAGKAALMYATAVLGFRLGERRALAQWTMIDFATAVAVGAIIGRTAVASNQSFIFGAVALAALLMMHRLASLARFNRLLAKLIDHRVRVLVERGELRRDQLRLCGLTDDDLFAQLRQRGVFDLRTVRYVLYETKGNLTVVPETEGDADRHLVAVAIEDSTGFTNTERGTDAAVRTP